MTDTTADLDQRDRCLAVTISLKPEFLERIKSELAAGVPIHSVSTEGAFEIVDGTLQVNQVVVSEGDLGAATADDGDAGMAVLQPDSIV